MREASILIVDDMSVLRNLVSRTLQHKMGIEHIHIAENGKAALEILRKKPVDIILSDWNMPVMNGEELLYEVRNDSKLKNIPFIMMTTNSNRDFIVTAIQLGVSNYITKPFTPHQLAEKLRTVWGYHCRRLDDRHACLPAHKLTVAVDEFKLGGQLLDLSQTGCLIQLKGHPSLSLFKICEVQLELIDPQGVDKNVAVIDSLFGMIVRLEAANSFHPTSLVCHMALYFNACKMNAGVSSKLSKLIQWLSSRSPDLIG